MTGEWRGLRVIVLGLTFVPEQINYLRWNWSLAVAGGPISQKGRRKIKKVEEKEVQKLFDNKIWWLIWGTMRIDWFKKFYCRKKTRKKNQDIRNSHKNGECQNIDKKNSELRKIPEQQDVKQKVPKIGNDKKNQHVTIFPKKGNIG